LDLTRPVDAPPPAPPPSSRGTAQGRPAAGPRVVTRGGQTSRLVVPSKPSTTPAAQGAGTDDDDASGQSWWTRRATSGVEAGFNRETILAEQPADPAAPGGLFDRLGAVLVELQGRVP